MSDPYLGEIRMFAGNFAPSGWALCNGQLLNISQYSALFAILGTYYGGDGVRTFALPNLQGTVPINWGNARSGTTYQIGETGGVETVQLTNQTMPQHFHLMNVNNAAGLVTDPTNAVLAQINTGSVRTPTTTAMGYTSNPPTGTAAPTAIAAAGGNQPHENRQPYLCVTFIIALQGIFPSRN